MPEIIEAGSVWLVGAGPGDPDLLTRKAEKLISAADIIFYDALVGLGVLDLIPPGVEKVSVGKRSGQRSMDQHAINNLIVTAAKSGKGVVRLKGGDPSIFGRSMEEVEACAAHGVPVHICPGITTACAAAASAGISLTLRGHSRKLTFITAHAMAGGELGLNWLALADPQATLVIYMGRSVASILSTKLQKAGLPASAPVLVVENASLPDERIVRTRLDLLEFAVPRGAAGPVLMILGQAVSATPPFELAAAAQSANISLCQLATSDSEGLCG